MMKHLANRSILAVTLLSLGAPLAVAGQLMCPDTSDASHQREVMATSAPEIKVRASSQEDSHRWAEIVKPLTQKAIKLAKTQRSMQIEDGIEHGCNSMEQYVGQIVPVADKPSGCDHRVVTRPADPEHVWVEVVAICKYNWACCASEESKVAPDTKSSHAGNSAGYTLEGPMNPNPKAPATAPAASASPSDKSKH